MNDDERLARLSDLARRVPGWEEARVEIDPDIDGSGRHDAMVLVPAPHFDGDAIVLHIGLHAHAADALEAALIVLVHGRESLLTALSRMAQRSER